MVENTPPLFFYLFEPVRHVYYLFQESFFCNPFIPNQFRFLTISEIIFSLASKLLTTTLKTYGQGFLKRLLQPLVHSMIESSEVSYEINPLMVCINFSKQCFTDLKPFFVNLFIIILLSLKKEKN